MACAYRVAAARAELGQPEINLHVLPGFGGTQMLPRLALRRARAAGADPAEALGEALEVLLDGRRRSADRAQRLGLVDEVAPADALSRALAVAGQLARGESSGLALWSPMADDGPVAAPDVHDDPRVARLLAHHRRFPRHAVAEAILEVVRLGLTEGLEAGLAREAARFGELTASDEGRAGLDRFLARRSWPLPPRRES
jgi:acrylyl-CoA reductase (NADPH)/3-hydroxypropionyl-CoA dehydratase/3-hydroxypropionyl-CoA synthetase